MHNDVHKKIYASAMMFILVVVMFFPVLQAQKNLANPLPLNDTNWWDTTWSYRKLITIDHTNVASDLSDFTVLIDISSDADLAARAQDDGDDIAFVLYSDNTTQLNHELELFNGTTGRTVAWVNVPSLSSIIDLKIWLYYGNNICPSQQNVASTWNSDYLMVQHMNETGTIYDSTSHGYIGTNYGTTTELNGKIGACRYFNATDDLYDFGNATSLNPGMNSWTISLWTKITYVDAYRVLSKWGSNAGFILYLFDNGVNRYNYIKVGDSVNTKKPYRYWDTSWSDGNWHYITAVINRNSNQIDVYLDGILHNGYTNANLSGMESIASTTNFYLYGGTDGRHDEFTISTTICDASWIMTSYNNQNNPASFYSLGSQEQAPSNNQPPIVSSENPADHLVNVNINIPSISVVIQDPEGQPFNWTITTSPNIGSNSGNNEFNGTKSCIITGLTYSTSYTWTVKANDGEKWTNKTYTFTTQQGAAITVNITKPLENKFYFQDQERINLMANTIVYGPITITAEVTSDSDVILVEFYIDGALKSNDTDAPYEYLWQPVIQFNGLSLKHTIKVVAYNEQGYNTSDVLNVTKWRFHILPWVVAGVVIASGLVLHTKITGLVYNLQESRLSVTFYAVHVRYKTIGPFKSARGVINMKGAMGGPIIGPTSMTRLGLFHKFAFGSFTFLGSVHYTAGGLGQGLIRQLFQSRSNSNLRN